MGGGGTKKEWERGGKLAEIKRGKTVQSCLTAGNLLGLTKLGFGNISDVWETNEGGGLIVRGRK